MSFLTVEDVNSILLNYGNINEFFVLDTSKLDYTKKQRFSYDFVSIWKENGNFYFNVYNSLWTGGYYITDKDGNYIDDCQISYIKSRFCYGINGTLPNGFKIHFYMTNYHDKFQLTNLRAYIPNLKNFTVRYNSKFSHRFEIAGFDNGYDFEGTDVSVVIGSNTYAGVVDRFNEVLIQTNVPLTESCKCSIRIYGTVYYFFINVLKDNLIFDLDGDLLVGAVNTINIITDENQELDGVSASLNVDGVISDLNFEDKQFIIDLSDETLAREVSVIITVNESSFYYAYVHEFTLKSHYFRPDSFASLKSEMERIDGTPIIELTSKLTFDNYINVNHDVLIKSSDDNKIIINLNYYGFILNENITFKADNIRFNKGNPAIIQKIGSTVDINNSDFGGCTNNSVNDIGSVIYCDIDINSLNDANDFISSFNNCFFSNNHCDIFHGGQLTVDNCKFRKNKVACLDYDNPAFIYQVDGDATITNSIFDIDLKDNYILSKNIGFAQAILMCGETATVNNATHASLQSDNSLPFFDAPFNNKSHLFAGYYYPQIDDAVFSSPNHSYEDKACCHCVSGVNWLFKENIQITRVDWGTENNKRIISW